MSKKKRENTGFRFQTRPSYAGLGISRERIRELQSGCMTERYTPEMLSKACEEFKFLEPWILLSVTKDCSYDAMVIKWELRELERPIVGRSDFYGYRRKFYHNLDCLLREEKENTPVKERGKG